MSIYKWTPVVPDKAKDITLGIGEIYYNMSEVSETLIGSTQGGSELRLNRIVVPVRHDGALGNSKGLNQITMFEPDFIVNFLKVNNVSLAYGLDADINTGSDIDGTYKEITPRFEYQATDVMTNVGFSGFQADGTPIKFYLFNCINMNNIQFKHEEKKQVIAPITYSAFYGHNTPDVVPFEIWKYLSA